MFVTHNYSPKGFIPNSINIGLDGQFAGWVGALIPDVRQELLLVCEPGQEQETLTRLARVGYDHVLGYLAGGFSAWEVARKDVDTITSIAATELANRLDKGGITVIDVRKPGEFSAEHMEGVKNIPLDYLSEHMAEFPKKEPFYIHCAGGYRSMMAASILKARGFDNVIDVAGDFAAIKQTDRIKTTNYVCPSTLKKA